MAYSSSDIAKALADPGASGPGGVYNQIRASMGSTSSSGGGGGGSSAPAPAPSSPVSQNQAGEPVYQTVNGPRTASQMMNELFKAGWDGSGEIKQVYARTTGGTVTPTGSTAPATTNAPVAPAGTQPPLANTTAANQLLNQAQQAAYQAYLNARLALDTDQEAFTKAQAAFTNKISEAGLTGQYNGAPTLAGQQQQFQQGIETAGLTGTYGGAPTLAAQNQAAQLSGMYNGAPTEAARQANNATALSYLNLISGLKGPQDYGQYLRTLGSTPGGLRDLVASAAGQYRPATGATTGVTPTPASLGGLVNAAATGTSGGTAYADYMNTAAGLPKPNQISADAWNAYTDSQKKVLLGMYQSGGYNPQDVQDLYNQSLPKYGYTGTGTVKL